MTNETNDKRPTHIVWQVIGGDKEGERGFWLRIGAAWAHKKGNGFSVELDAAPLKGRVVILERKDEDDAAPADAPERGAGMTPVVDPEVAVIRDLNDRFRTSFAGGQIMVTSGVRALGSDFLHGVVFGVRGYTAFDEDSDPSGQHDFGVVTVERVRVYWKIDYYDAALEYGSPDPANPAVTTRVLTVLLPAEW